LVIFFENINFDLKITKKTIRKKIFSSREVQHIETHA